MTSVFSESVTTGAFLCHSGGVKFEFQKIIPTYDQWRAPEWTNWSWQMRQSLKTKKDFDLHLQLSKEELFAFDHGSQLFNIQATPYYATVAQKSSSVRRICVPHGDELQDHTPSELDPLGERKKSNNPTARIIHRYSDRVLFLVTDICSVYCRYCTRKHFTGKDEAFLSNTEYEQALNYIRSKKGLREVILSGGDPLTLSNEKLEKILNDLRKIEHIEIIRIGTRMPVVNPMRIDADLVQILRKYKPVYLMTHFNHPDELTYESAQALELFVDHGIPVMNQMVLLNGVNNHAAIVQALSRRLLYLRVKPYYMFQCDPSQGTDYLRISIEESLEIQKQLWGHLSGLAMPQLSLDIPQGGGKAYYVPNFETEVNSSYRSFKGWDGVEAKYYNPKNSLKINPSGVEKYLQEWDELRNSKN